MLGTKKRSPLATVTLEVLWLLGCGLTLGYAPEYYRRILSWQVYDPAKKHIQYTGGYPVDVNSANLDLKNLKKAMRTKQQEEWDRLVLPLSVITATSAAALAIPSPFGTPNIYWLATAFFSGAFGLSLEGLIIITYLTVFSARSSTAAFGRLASGKGFLKSMIGLAAIMTALPTALTTYSSLFLLAGLLAMTIAAGEATNIQQHMVAFKAIVLVLVCLMLLCLAITVAGFEVRGALHNVSTRPLLSPDPLLNHQIPMSNEPKQGVSLNSIVLAVLWQLGCVLTLGYAPKYNRRVQTWQAHDTTGNPTETSSNNGHCSPNCTLPHPELVKKSSARAKQQKEWDRLMMPLSVITATSAAALAIPSPFGTPNVYWLATAFFSGALGLSLEGLIIVTYLTVFGASSSPKTIGRIAKGKRFLKGTTGPVAVITALPTAITTYSSLFLLAGLLAMTIEAGEGGTIQEHIRAFKAIVLVPVYLMLLCLIVTVAGCEFFAWKEKPTKESSDVERRGSGEDKASTESIASVGGAYSTGSGGTGPRRRTTAENVGVA